MTDVWSQEKKVNIKKTFSCSHIHSSIIRKTVLSYPLKVTVKCIFPPNSKTFCIFLLYKHRERDFLHLSCGRGGTKRGKANTERISAPVPCSNISIHNTYCIYSRAVYQIKTSILSIWQACHDVIHSHSDMLSPVVADGEMWANAVFKSNCSLDKTAVNTCKFGTL